MLEGAQLPVLMSSSDTKIKQWHVCREGEVTPQRTPKPKGSQTAH